jgi:ATP-dependent DNA helicase DinG
VPMAVIRFKQGFGRLIRSRSDRGIVLVLDRRVATKFYGKVFRESLPPAGFVKASAASVLESLRAFYADRT